MNNFRYAVRLLLKSPGFALVAILTLALGIGVNSAIFSVVDAVMLRPLPYLEPDRIVSLWEATGKEGPDDVHTSGQTLGGDSRGRMTVAPANLIDYQKQQHSFSGMAGFALAGMNLTESGPPERLSGERVMANYFSVLGVGPAQGRPFLTEGDRPNANHVVIVTDELWRNRFGADPHLLGSHLVLGFAAYSRDWHSHGAWRDSRRDFENGDRPGDAVGRGRNRVRRGRRLCAVAIFEEFAI